MELPSGLTISDFWCSLPFCCLLSFGFSLKRPRQLLTKQFMQIMSLSATSYKDEPAHAQPSSSPLLPTRLPLSSPSVTARTSNTTTTIRLHHPRFSPSFSERPRSLPCTDFSSGPQLRQSKPRLSCPTPPSPADPGHTPKRVNHYDWSPVLLLTPPPSSHIGISRATSSSLGKRHTPDSFGTSPYHVGRRFHAKATDFSSPTLSTRRAKALSQLKPLPMLLPCTAMELAANNEPSQIMVSHSTSLNSPKPTQVSEHVKSSTPALIEAPTRAKGRELPKLMPFTKPRALTLDGMDRPVLPPLLGNLSPNRFGPIRTSSSRTSSSFRHAVEHKSNPYFVFSQPRRPVDYFTLPVSSSRGARGRSTSSPFQ